MNKDELSKKLDMANRILPILTCGVIALTILYIVILWSIGAIDYATFFSVSVPLMLSYCMVKFIVVEHRIMDRLAEVYQKLDERDKK